MLQANSSDGIYCTDISEKVKVMWCFPGKNAAENTAGTPAGSTVKNRREFGAKSTRSRWIQAASALLFHLRSGKQVMPALRADPQDQHAAHNPLSAVRADTEKPRHHDHADHAGRRADHKKHLLP